jgi:ribosome-binding protein aMBF1 (putative translation factor)
MNKKQNAALKKMRNLPLNDRGSVSGDAVIKCMEEFILASGNPVGSRIKECRSKFDLSKKSVAKRLTWTVYRLTQVENKAKAISVKDAKRLAQIFKTTPEWILTGSFNGIKS